jgi:chloride channel 7
MLDPHRMHELELTPAQRQKQATFESIDYYKQYTGMYTDHLWRRYARRHHGGHDGRSPVSAATTFADQLDDKATVTRWVLHVAIAAVVGVVAFAVTEAIAALEDWRVDTTTSLVEGAGNAAGGYILGVLFWIASACALVAVSTCTVVFFEPAAGGSGIPEVMAFLNGVNIPKVVSLSTFVGKCISTIGSVAGGLPVGAEAPLIHLGAIIGAGVPQGRSRALGCQTSYFREFRNHKDKRDFVTAGAACGVSAAFGAPIGGLLFVMEEVSSFWDVASTSQVFLGTMVCFTVIAIINSMHEATSHRGFVSNKASVMFEVEYAGDTALNVASIIPAAILGVICGILGAVWTRANLAVVKWRRATIKPFNLRRIAEPVAVVAIFAFLGFTLPYMLGCDSTVNADVADNQVNTTADDVQSWHTENGTVLAKLMCDKEHEYSPLGTLTVKGIGKGVIRRLFSRRTVGEFSLGTLLIFFVMYFTFAGYISGSAISSGMVVPMIVIGAVIGRIYGVALVSLFADTVTNKDGQSVRAFFADQAWMDPGVFALIGAGAFFGGVTRMTISLAVIMVELSGELHYLLPIMVAIVSSKAVADLLCEPLYHQLMHLDFIPYLPTEVPGVDLELLNASDVCSEGAVCLAAKERVTVVIDALQTGHHCFPVLRGTKLVGIATREDLQILLALPQFQASIAATAVQVQQHRGSRRDHLVDVSSMKFEDWIKHKMALFFVQGSKEWHANWSPAGIAQRERDRAMANSAASTPPQQTPSLGSSPAPAGLGSELSADLGRSAVASPSDLPRDDSIVMSLEPVIDRSPWIVPSTANCSNVFSLFRTMGMRHTIVVDGDRVAGIITRKDLLPHELRLAMRRAALRRLGRAGDDDAVRLSFNEDEEEVKNLGGGFFGQVKAFFAPRFRVTDEEMTDETDDSEDNANRPIV